MFIKKIEVHRKQTKGQHKTKKNNQQKKHAIYENSKQCCEGCESKKIGIAVMRARTRENSNTTSPPFGMRLSSQNIDIEAINLQSYILSTLIPPKF